MKINIFIILFITVCLNLFPSNFIINENIDKSIRTNDWVAAKTQLDKYILSNPNDVYAYNVYSTVLDELKLYDEEISILKTAIGIESNNEKKGELYFNMGRAYYNKKIKDVALQMCEKSISLNALLDSPYVMLGLIYYENKNYDKCIDNWKQYVRLTSNMDKKKKIEDAISYLSRSIEQQKIDEALKIQKDKELAELKAKTEAERLAKLKALQDELANSESDTKSLDDFKTKNKKIDPGEDELQ